MTETPQFETLSMEVTNTRVVRVRVRGAEPVAPKFLDGTLDATEVRLAYVQRGDEPWGVRDMAIMGRFTPRFGEPRVHTETFQASDAPTRVPAWALNLAAKYLPSEIKQSTWDRAVDADRLAEAWWSATRPETTWADLSECVRAGYREFGVDILQRLRAGGEFQ